MATPPKPVRRPTFPSAKPPVKTPTTPAPPAVVEAMPEAIARLPLAQPENAGRLLGPEVVQPRALSDLEKQGLRLIGHDPTRPVPREALEELARRVAEEKARMDAAADTRYTEAVDHFTRQPTVAPQAVDVGDLSEIERTQALNKMQAMLATLNRPAAPASTPPQPPQRPTVSSPWANVIPDVPPPAPPPPPPPPEGPTGPTGDPGPEGLPGPTNDHGGLGATPKFCPRCGFDCQDVDPIKPTEDDTTTFLTCILATPARRYTRTYSRFGGRLRLTFGELNPKTTDDVTRALHRAANRDADANNPGSQAFYVNMGATYRALLSLVRVETAEQVVDLATGWADAAAAGATVEQYVEWLTTETLPTDSMLVVVRRAYEEFNQMCQKLREAAAHPDFYTAIG